MLRTILVAVCACVLVGCEFTGQESRLKEAGERDRAREFETKYGNQVDAQRALEAIIRERKPELKFLDEGLRVDTALLYSNEAGSDERTWHIKGRIYEVHKTDRNFPGNSHWINGEMKFVNGRFEPVIVDFDHERLVPPSFDSKKLESSGELK